MTQPERVLAMLREGPKTTGDFCETTLAREYPRAIWWLRRHGYVIHTAYVRKGCWRFALVAEPPTVAGNGQLVFGYERGVAASQ